MPSKNSFVIFQPANAEILIGEFLKPLGEDISVLPNNGWYTTPKTHKKWGFDLSVTASSVFVSNENISFNYPSVSGLNYLGTDAGGAGGPGSPVPTVYGKERVNPEFEITSGSNSGIIFRGPDGFEPGKEYLFEAQPIFTIQGGVGLFKNTDLRLRFTPKVTIQSVEFGNWGIGMMHDLKQHLFGETENNFSLSLFVGYTQVNGSVDLSGTYTGSGQEAKVTSSGVTVQAIVGKQFKVISFYGALGYDSGNTTIDIDGTYTVSTYTDVFGDQMPLNQPITFSDPFNFKFDTSGMRITAGTRLKLGPVTINADYSFIGDNRVLAAGLGFTVN